MNDPRNAQLAAVIVSHSLQVEPGEVVLIESFDLVSGLPNDLVDAIHAAGGIPLLYLRSQALLRQVMRRGDEREIGLRAQVELAQLRLAQGYVAIRAQDNVSELSDVPSAHVALNGRMTKDAMDYRVDHTKWVVLRYPTASMAQLAGMSTQAFEDLYYRVCTLDYGRMADAIAPLAERMRRTDEVRISGPGTDLRFSIRGIGSVPCEGRRNLPDGECFTAPVRDSVHGVISYNTSSLYQGTTYTDIRLVFEGGRIVRATGQPQDRLDALLDSDEGARYVGEFSLGFNPHLLSPIKDTLFDEKIAGSLHFTPGQAYGIADNGNRSQVHWDLVLIQRPEFGGGEVWFDGERIRKDGRFVAPDLLGLNPERLLGNGSAAG